MNKTDLLINNIIGQIKPIEKYKKYFTLNDLTNLRPVIYNMIKECIHHFLLNFGNTSQMSGVSAYFTSGKRKKNIILNLSFSKGITIIDKDEKTTIFTATEKEDIQNIEELTKRIYTDILINALRNLISKEFPNETVINNFFDNTLMEYRSKDISVISIGPDIIAGISSTQCVLKVLLANGIMKNFSAPPIEENPASTEKDSDLNNLFKDYILNYRFEM